MPPVLVRYLQGYISCVQQYAGPGPRTVQDHLHRSCASLGELAMLQFHWATKQLSWHADCCDGSSLQQLTEDPMPGASCIAPTGGHLSLHSQDRMKTGHVILHSVVYSYCSYSPKIIMDVMDDPETKQTEQSHFLLIKVALPGKIMIFHL